MSSIWTVRRSATDTKVAGLCGGVAEHWGVDPVLVRVGWVLLALSGGVGAVLYLAGWLLIPLEGQSQAPLDDLLGENVRRWPKGVWVALVAAACVAVFATFGAVSPFGVGPAVILGCIWYFGFYRSRQPRPGQRAAAPAPLPPPAPATPFTEAVQAWQRRIEEHAQQHGPHPSPAPATVAAGSAPTSTTSATWPVMPGATPTAPAEPDPELAGRTAFLAEPDPVGLYSPATVEGSDLEGTLSARALRAADRLSARRLRLGAVAVLGLALAGLGLADQSGVTVIPAVYAATALLVVGLTLVAATWLGRARGLLPLGLLLVPVVLATTAVGPVTHLDHWADTRHSYVRVDQLPPAGDSQQAGQLVVDLSDLPAAAGTSYTAHLGTGRLEVVAPPGAEVVLDYRVDLGEVRVDGQRVTAGSGGVGTTTLSPPSPATATKAAPTLTLHLSVDRGQLEVHR